MSFQEKRGEREGKKGRKEGRKEREGKPNFRYTDFTGKLPLPHMFRKSHTSKTNTY